MSLVLALLITKWSFLKRIIKGVLRLGTISVVSWVVQQRLSDVVCEDRDDHRDRNGEDFDVASIFRSIPALSDVLAMELSC